MYLFTFRFFFQNTETVSFCGALFFSMASSSLCEYALREEAGDRLKTPTSLEYCSHMLKRDLHCPVRCTVLGDIYPTRHEKVI